MLTRSYFEDANAVCTKFPKLFSRNYGYRLQCIQNTKIAKCVWIFEMLNLSAEYPDIFAGFNLIV